MVNPTIKFLLEKKSRGVPRLFLFMTGCAIAPQAPYWPERPVFQQVLQE